MKIDADVVISYLKKDLNRALDKFDSSIVFDKEAVVVVMCYIGSIHIHMTRYSTPMRSTSTFYVFCDSITSKEKMNLSVIDSNKVKAFLQPLANMRDL